MELILEGFMSRKMLKTNCSQLTGIVRNTPADNHLQVPVPIAMIQVAPSYVIIPSLYLRL